MKPGSRRRFLRTMAATPVLSAASSFSTSEASASNSAKETPNDRQEPVVLFGDGLSLSSADYVSLLQRIVEQRGIAEDDYSLGGVVEELEGEMARARGKESAIYFPTGTLANHVAVRVLARDRDRVLSRKRQPPLL